MYTYMQDRNTELEVKERGGKLSIPYVILMCTAARLTRFILASKGATSGATGAVSGRGYEHELVYSIPTPVVKRVPEVRTVLAFLGALFKASNGAPTLKIV